MVRRMGRQFAACWMGLLFSGMAYSQNWTKTKLSELSQVKAPSIDATVRWSTQVEACLDSSERSLGEKFSCIQFLSHPSLGLSDNAISERRALLIPIAERVIASDWREKRVLKISLSLVLNELGVDSLSSEIRELLSSQIPAGFSRLSAVSKEVAGGVK